MSVCLYLIYVKSFRLVSGDRHFSTLGHFLFCFGKRRVQQIW